MITDREFIEAIKTIKQGCRERSSKWCATERCPFWLDCDWNSDAGTPKNWDVPKLPDHLRTETGDKKE